MGNKQHIISIYARLSPAGKVYAGQLAQIKKIDFAIEIFVDAVRNSRFRRFMHQPEFYTNGYGKRTTKTVIPEAQRVKTIVYISLKTMRSIRRLTILGHSVSWIVEESLFYYMEHFDKNIKKIS